MRFVLFAFTLGLFTTACATDPGAGRTAATVSEVGSEPAPDANEGTVRLAVDPAQSSLALVGAKVTAQHDIVVHEYTASVGVDGDDVVSVVYEAQMASIEADHPKLTTHLLNEDFFDVPNHPTSTFVSTSIAAGSDDPTMTHTVTGELTLRGTTKQISFPATITRTAAGVVANTEFVIDRHDFGVSYPGRKDDLVKDNVLLKIAFVAPAGSGPAVD